MLRLDDEKDKTWQQVAGAAFKAGDATLDVKSFSIYAVAAGTAASDGSTGNIMDGGAEPSGASQGGASQGGASQGGASQGGADQGGADQGGTGSQSFEASCDATCSHQESAHCANQPSHADCVSNCVEQAALAPVACTEVGAALNTCLQNDADGYAYGADGTAQVAEGKCPMELSALAKCLTDEGALGPASSGSCEASGGLPASPAGQANIVAKLSDASDDFNGTAGPFTALESAGTASPGLWTARTEAPSADDSTNRVIQFFSTPTMPAACDEYTTTAGPDTVQLTYEEGGPITGNFKKWFCAGTTTVDTVDGSAYSFHFGPLECTTFSIVQNTAAGSFTLIGTGAATYAE